MANIHKGRYSADIDGEFVVFIIGMRINRLWAIHKWLPVFKSMGPMIRELYMNPDTGFLGTEYFMSWRGVTLLQYWRSYDELEKYARGGLHLEAWKRFNQSVGSDGSVGIYHETYKAQPGSHETIYANMPRFGLAKVSNHISATGRKETSRRRMGGENDPAVQSPENP
ncbi:MAG TPA: DUF4188 domain-containing protein [Paenibacillus sp.]|uniref:DUF4188 domain-containing protein n=1 Tax=Paenibacillus TaxID=44249 RepID=UPI000BA008D0|nr:MULTISPECIES: DUF4188 domain-containing protein [Paenibacillus]OZQ69998.1 transcriptional regulator [Paenibacillus taichungensis]HBU84292.1 DUF4188 domain-containing protein [Paenibacillus sp.]